MGLLQSPPYIRISDFFRISAFDIRIFAHELPRPPLSARRFGCRSARGLPSHPPHDPRAHALQFPHVPAPLTAAFDPPQPARTYPPIAVTLRRSLLARPWLCAAIYQKTDEC